ncbi:MAG TPA: glycosyltransferase family 2 protein [Candidatus Jacksonbacteria bacterium]|nr:glycosyltransferase family 2 protein [Candidatus Jacksonbacteria bacterium]
MIAKNMNNQPFVSIIIPCRNEGKFIVACIESILENDYPKDRMEIFVIDGMSTDHTRETVRRFVKRYPFIFLLDNQHKHTAAALNMGIKKSTGSVIMRLDAHTTYTAEYISKCVYYLQKYNADNVGGVIKTIPGSSTVIGKSIAIALAHSFGIGNSKFRTGIKNYREADTVPFGCFKREVFNNIGLFNKNLHRSQDMEFNLRLKKSGGKILLFGDISANYYADKTLLSFIKHNFQNGIWATYPLKFTKQTLSARHYIPCLFVSAILLTLILSMFSAVFKIILLIILALYFTLLIPTAAQISVKQKKPVFILTMPIIFSSLHISYGLGSILGLIKILLDTWNQENNKNSSTMIS